MTGLPDANFAGSVLHWKVGYIEKMIELAKSQTVTRTEPWAKDQCVAMAEPRSGLLWPPAFLFSQAFASRGSGHSAR